MARFARLAVLVLTAAAFAALPAIAQADPGHGNRCGKGHAKHTRGIGKTCVKHHKGNAKRRDKVAPAPATVSAEVVKQCKDELVANAAAFQAKYANAAGREALGRCIRINAGLNGDKPASAPPVQYDFAAAAEACASEKAADESAFVAKYGDENGREAFGHCVRANAQPVAQTESGDDQGDDTQGDDATGDAGKQSDAPDSDDSGDDTPADDTQKSADGLDSLFF